MASKINIRSFFSNSRKSYSGYPEKILISDEQFWISVIMKNFFQMSNKE